MLEWLLYLMALVHPPLRYALQPTSVMLAWTENPRELAVRWSTGLPQAGAHLFYRPMQCDGSAVPKQEWLQSAATWERFEHKGTYVTGHVLYTSIMQGLNSNCLYEYQVGTSLFFSDTYMVSGRSPGAMDGPVRLVVYGDMGAGKPSEVVRTHLRSFITKESVDGVLHLGDIAYNLDWKRGRLGDQFLNELEGIADRVPYMFTPGNHESDKNFTQYKRRFRMPWNSDNEGTNMFYSLTLGPVHIVMYNTELIRFGTRAEMQRQRAWLLKDLVQANETREEVPWLILAGHKPFYCNPDWTLPWEDDSYKQQLNQDCHVETHDLRHLYEDLAYHYGVDLVLAGHVHKYERDAAVFHNMSVASERDEFNLHWNARAPVHIVSGGAGNRLGVSPVSRTPQAWSRVDSLVQGFGLVTVFNKTHLLWQQFSSQDQSQLDYVWLIKNRTRY